MQLECLYLPFLGILTLAPLETNAQSIWELGNVPLDTACTTIGFPLLPGVDPWVFNAHCATYNGSAGCFDGTCKCNQGADSYFNETLQMCVGRVGAICSAEHSSLFPDKLCTPNADCQPVQGEGYSVGKCECLYGYIEDEEGLCIEDEQVEEGDRSTSRTTTTTEPPEPAPFKLPLSLLFGSNFVTYGNVCHSKALMNHTYCSTHSATVSCQEEKCACNMQEDSIFDAELNMCVGLVGTYCLGRKYVLGYHACTKNADCVLEDGTSLEKGYSFGTCKCIYGYKETKAGTCERDETIPISSTPVTIIPPTGTTGKMTVTPSSRRTTTEPSNGTTTDDPNENSVHSGIFLISLFSFGAVVVQVGLLIKFAVYLIHKRFKV